MPRFTGLKAKVDDEHTMLINGLSGQFYVSVEPANRFNGTQVFDGRFPRKYKTVASAKAGVTKFLGRLDWENI